MRYVFACVLLLGALTVGAVTTAQNSTPIPIVTNTPRGVPALPELATNTPRPPTATPRTPADFNVFALRLWSSADGVQLAEDQLRLLNETGSRDAALTARLAVYELSVRYPDALRNEANQERLLPLMLSAPRGTVDMRPVVRRYVERIVSENPDTVNPERPASYTVGAFRVDVTPLNASPLTETEVMLAVRTPPDAPPDERLYDDVVLARYTEANALAIYPATPDYPAAPFNSVQAVALAQMGDLNGDGADEIAVAVQYRDQLNDDLYVYGVRGDRAVELTVPDERMRFGGTPTWDAGAIQLNEQIPQAGSFWGCAQQQAVTWAWGNNVFVPQLGAMSDGEGLACDLDAMGNLFAQAPTDALTSIEFAYEPDAATPDFAARVELVAAVLHLLNAQPESAVVRASAVIQAEANNTRTAQAEALLAAVGENRPPLAVCADYDGDLCQLDAVVGRLLSEPFSEDSDVEAQLEARGLPVQQVITLEEVGRRSRPAAQLALGDGSVWVVLSPSGDGRVATVTEPPPGFAPPPPAPMQTTVTANLLPLLLTSDDRTPVVTALDTLEADVGALPPELGFLRAFANDLSGNRQVARRQYFDLWQSDPDGVWGQFAARHLERR